MRTPIHRRIRLNVFARLMLSHLTVTLISLLAIIPISNVTLTSVRDRQVMEAYVQLEGSLAQLAHEFESATTLMTLLSRDQGILRTALYRTIEPNQYYHIASSRNLLRFSTLNWNYLNNCYVLFARNEVVLSAERVWFTYDAFYGRWLHCEGMDLEAWRAQVNADMRAGVRRATGNSGVYSFMRTGFDGAPREAILYSLPFVNTSGAGMMVFVVDVSDILDALGVEDADFLYVRDAAGTPIANVRAPEEVLSGNAIDTLNVQGTAYTVMTASDAASGLTWVLGRPTARIQDPSARVYTLLAGYATLVLALGMVLSTAFAHREYSPVKRLNAAVRSLSSNGGEPQRNEYEYLLKSFLHMHQKNIHFMRTLDDQVRALRRQSLEALLHRRHAGHDELKRLSEAVPLPERYRLAIVQINRSADAEDKGAVDHGVLLSSLTDQADHALDAPVLTHVASGGRLVLIFPDAGARRQVECAHQEMRRVLGMFKDAGEADLFIAVSGPHTGAGELNPAFVEALNIVTYRFSLETAAAFMEDIEESARAPMLTESSANKLRACIAQDDERGAATLIESLFRSHYLKNDEFSQLYYGIRGVLLSARARFGDCPVEIPYGSVELPRDAQIAALIKSCRALCAYCRDRKSSRNAELRDAIVAWLKDHYTDMDTYGKSVAIQFGISEKYLYTFFREQVGIGFATYLENLRIGHAEALLRDTKLPVQEIARLSGFNSSNTFYKAFLRVNGVSPTKHRALDRGREA